MAAPLTEFLKKQKLMLWNNLHAVSIPPPLAQYFVLCLKLCAFLFGIISLSGLFLQADYAPSKQPYFDSNGNAMTIRIAQQDLFDPEGDIVARNGQMLLIPANGQENVLRPAQAYISIHQGIMQKPAGKWLRSVHVWSTHALILLCLFLPFLLISAKIRFGRLLWHIVWGLVILCMCLAWTGFILPWDQFSVTSWSIIMGILKGAADWAGGLILADILGGNSAITLDNISRVSALHTTVLPLMAALSLFMIYRISAQSQPNEEVSGYYTALPIAITVFVLLLAAFFPLYSMHIPADALNPKAAYFKPEWFFLPMNYIFGILPADLALLLWIFLPGILFLLPGFKKGRITILSILYSVLGLTGLLAVLQK
jgi:quinol-cytochrome oxidoreductase complex cytochrome b subunit